MAASKAAAERDLPKAASAAVKAAPPTVGRATSAKQGERKSQEAQMRPRPSQDRMSTLKQHGGRIPSSAHASSNKSDDYNLATQHSPPLKGAARDTDPIASQLKLWLLTQHAASQDLKQTVSSSESQRRASTRLLTSSSNDYGSSRLGQNPKETKPTPWKRRSMMQPQR